MQRTYRRVAGCLLCLGLLLYGGCSEDDVTGNQDKEGPAVQFVLPISPPEAPVEYSEHVDIYVTATDNTAVSRVEFWGARETVQNPDQIATLTAPLSPVPDSIEAPPGMAVYGTRYSIRAIRNGSRVRLFARAFDAAGNSTRSDQMVIKVLNLGGNLYPPAADFFVKPPRGTVDSLFTFDASVTRDSVDTPSEIAVRWDFDGDGVWDRDWGEGLTAAVRVDFKYNRPRVYRPVLEAKNSYLPDSTARATQELEVTPAGGVNPVPPEPENMILIPAGVYRVGSPDLSNPQSDELPQHRVRLTAEYYIEKTEVTNRLYLRYLKSVMSGDAPRVRREGPFLRYYPTTGEPLLLLDFNSSALFFDPDGDSVAVPAASRALPVVGVTWQGARLYCEHFGLRLPTEHEWEVAAKGDSLRFSYPWGTTIRPDQANYLDSRIGRPLPVGSYPAWTGQFGLLDVCGNAQEWTKDWYAPYPERDELLNPEGPISGSRRVLRGGSYILSATGVRVTSREAGNPDQPSDVVGFRTAYTKP